MAFCNGNKLNKNNRFRQKARNQFSTPSPLTPASAAWPYIASFCAPLVPLGHRRLRAHGSGRGGRPGRVREPRRRQIYSGAREKVLESDNDARRLALTRRRPDLGVRVPARAGGGARTSSSASSTTRRRAPLLPDGRFASVFLIGIDWYSIALGWGRYRLCIVRYQITARVDYAWAETNRSVEILNMCW